MIVVIHRFLSKVNIEIEYQMFNYWLKDLFLGQQSFCGFVILKHWLSKNWYIPVCDCRIYGGQAYLQNLDIEYSIFSNGAYFLN